MAAKIEDIDVENVLERFTNPCHKDKKKRHGVLGIEDFLKKGKKQSRLVTRGLNFLGIKPVNRFATWTEADDYKILSAIKDGTCKPIKALALKFEGKSVRMVRHRIEVMAKKLLTDPDTQKSGAFSREELCDLFKAMIKVGSNSWTGIADELGGVRPFYSYRDKWNRMKISMHLIYGFPVDHCTPEAMLTLLEKKETVASDKDKSFIDDIVS